MHLIHYERRIFVVRNRFSMDQQVMESPVPIIPIGRGNRRGQPLVDIFANVTAKKRKSKRPARASTTLPARAERLQHASTLVVPDPWLAQLGAPASGGPTPPRAGPKV